MIRRALLCCAAIVVFAGLIFGVLFYQWGAAHGSINDYNAKLDALYGKRDGLNCPEAIALTRGWGFPAKDTTSRTGFIVIDCYLNDRQKIAQRPAQTLSEGLAMIEQAIDPDGAPPYVQPVRFWYERTSFPEELTAKAREIAACWLRAERDIQARRGNGRRLIDTCIALRERSGFPGNISTER